VRVAELRRNVQRRRERRPIPATFDSADLSPNKKLKTHSMKGIMETIEKSIEVDEPVSVVYNQWTQFEDLPRFTDGIKEVQQLDDKRLHWRPDLVFRAVTAS
jgi:uncharacterized membrane protein